MDNKNKSLKNNKENRKFSVYMHTNKVNGKKYIGITCQNTVKRWNHGHGYKQNEHFKAAIKKYGWEEFTHEIIASGLTKEDACKLEKELIAKYETTNREKGYNICSGGEVNIPSEETRKKLSEYMKKSGRTLSREATLKSAAKNRGRKRNKKEYESLCKAVVVMNVKTKEEIEYESMKAAADAYNVNRAVIQEICKGKYNYFRYNNIRYTVWLKDGGKCPEKLHRGDDIVGVNLKTHEVTEYESAAQAERILGIPSLMGKISAAKNGKAKSSHGYIWFKKEEFPGVENINFDDYKVCDEKRTKKLMAIDENGNTLFFDSSTDAGRKLNHYTSAGNIRAAAKNGHICLGYLWFYVDE